MTQQNSKFKLCEDKDETINYIINECSKLAQKEYKTRHDWVGVGDPLRIVQDIETRPYYQMVYAQTRTRPGKWDGKFEIQMNYRFLARRPDLMIVNKKKRRNLLNCELCHPSGPQSENQRKQKKKKKETNT